MATEKPRFSITIDADIASAVEDYRFNHRINSRSEAIVDLIRIGLATVREQEMQRGGDNG